MASKEKLTRIAIVSHDRCKPKKCRQECKKSCPVVRMGECLGRDEAASSALKSCTRGGGQVLGFEASWACRLPTGKLCIEVTPADKIATISEQLCIGCGICVKVSTPGVREGGGQGQHSCGGWGRLLKVSTPGVRGGCLHQLYCTN